MGDGDIGGRLSVVVPCHCEEESLTVLHRRLTAALAETTAEYEIILVDDGSGDATRETMRALRRADPRVRWIGLTRNFGQQAALTAGLARARGDWVVTMDADLQHPPELVPELLRQARKGYDVVLTQRKDPVDTGLFKRFSSAVFYRLLSWMGGVRIAAGSSDFQLLSRRALQALVAMPERHRFLRGLVRWTGFRSVTVPFQAEARYAGEPAYGLRRSVRLALDAVFSFSILPMRVASMVGLLAIVSSAIYAGWVLYAAVILDIAIAGWASLMVVVLLLGGLQILTLGILGEYVVRVYQEAKARPLFLIEDEDGFGTAAGSPPTMAPPAPPPATGSTPDASERGGP
jgi:dolichol-phosphate mannosyltransferase